MKDVKFVKIGKRLVVYVINTSASCRRKDLYVFKTTLKTLHDDRRCKRLLYIVSYTGNDESLTLKGYKTVIDYVNRVLKTLRTYDLSNL